VVAPQHFRGRVQRIEVVGKFRARGCVRRIQKPRLECLELGLQTLPIDLSPTCDRSI
jgi:hypothetical protein